MNNDNKWLSILEYAACTQTSISTIRRKIKSKKLTTKKLDGKYYILADSIPKILENINDESKKKLELENKRLKVTLSQKEEEINDLQMLISIYEGVKNKSSELPELPFA
jgi:hypothetical protein